jgi:hypothetical protein
MDVGTMLEADDVFIKRLPPRTRPPRKSWSQFPFAPIPSVGRAILNAIETIAFVIKFRST